MITYEKGEIHHMSEVETREHNGRQYANMTLVVSVMSSSSTFKYVALRVQNDRIDDVVKLPKGTKVEVGYNVTSREWQGKWFTNVDLISIKPLEAARPKPEPADELNPSMSNDLPF